MSTILITGACGQLGSELTERLRSIYGNDKVIASDIRSPVGGPSEGPFEEIDVLDKQALAGVIDTYGVEQIYHLAALLSAKAEDKITFGWKLNMNGLLHVLELAREKSIQKVFWPSSIAVFGPDAPAAHTPQNTALNPTTVYGISKIAGEQWCAYYHRRFGIDVRSLRYPGLIGYKSPPGGGTTDYAVDIYHQALAHKKFCCFLKKDSYLPMMYMTDAINATMQLMQADAENISVRTSYNLGAMSFSPAEIAAEITKHIPTFQIEYQPDERQKIADSWPDSIDDEAARTQWGWKPQFGIEEMVADMLKHLSKSQDADSVV